ncbi:MAG: hypothetical protein ACW99Q_28645, partial [Candidatus Kariarchaeaceae archaeon]
MLKRSVKVKIILFSFVFLCLFSSVVISVKGYTPTVRADWLYVTTGSFVDKSPHSWENNVRIVPGGVDLIEFENLGMISSNDDEVLYKARSTFGFEITMNTDVDYNAVYPDINRDKQHSEWFLTVGRKYCWEYKTTIYSVLWNTIDLGTKRTHNYDGHIPVTVGIRNIRGNDGTIILNGQTFETPAYVADIVKTKVTGLRDGEVGVYKDLFPKGDVKEGTVEFQELDDDFSATESEIINYLNTADLGWRSGDIVRGQTLQQARLYGDQIGAEYSNIVSSDSYTFPLGARIQPEVYEMKQMNDIRYAKIKYGAEWCWSGLFEVLEGPATKTAPKRITAVHVNNYFLHWEFEVTVEFIATVESTAKLTQAILNDPYLKAGDMIWDVDFTGDYEVDVIPTRYSIGDWFSGVFGGLFGNIFTIIIIIVVVVVIY